MVCLLSILQHSFRHVGASQWRPGTPQAPTPPPCAPSPRCTAALPQPVHNVHADGGERPMSFLARPPLRCRHPPFPPAVLRAGFQLPSVEHG